MHVGPQTALIKHIHSPVSTIIYLMMLCRSGLYYTSEPSSVALSQVSSFPKKEVSGFS